ncbi:hypothetical protein, partial [Parabacteroides sp.]
FRYESLKRIAAFNVIVDLFLFLILPILNEAGILHDSVEVTSKGISHTFGFNNPNSLGLSGYFFMVSLYVLMHRKLKWLTLFLFIIINFYFNSISASRTSYFAGWTLIV